MSISALVLYGRGIHQSRRLSMSMKERMVELEEARARANLGGGAVKNSEQHSRGKMTARERIEALVDLDSFVEIDRYALHQTRDFGMMDKRILGDGVVTGYGKINGRQVYVFSHDFTVFGGSLGEMFAKKVTKIMDMALKTGCPIIGLNDSGGARIQEGVVSLGGYAEIFFRNVLASGVIPQISAIMGPCAGGAVYSPAMTDFTLMVEGTSYMFITGPDVIKTVLNQDVTFEELGGAKLHNSRSGVAHFYARDEKECIAQIRALLSYFPQNNQDDPPRLSPREPKRQPSELDQLLPNDSDRPYDMHEIITRIVDGGEMLEVQPLYARNIIVGFARLNGYSIGIVANQPKYQAGALDIDSSTKAGRFVRFCDAFNIPILTLVDVPGYMPGADEEHSGVIRLGSKLLFAYCEATVPKVTVITRKAYGGAYCAMGSKFSRADINYAWPEAEIAVMGPEGAVNVIFRKEIEGAADREATRKALLKDYRESITNPYFAASRGIIDDVIDPAVTRPKLISALTSLRKKKEFRPRKKHGNIQL